MSLYLAPGFPFLDPAYRSGDVSAIAPDALNGEILSVARFVAKDLGEDC